MNNKINTNVSDVTIKYVLDPCVSETNTINNIQSNTSTIEEISLDLKSSNSGTTTSLESDNNKEYDYNNSYDYSEYIRIRKLYDEKGYNEHELYEEYAQEKRKIVNIYQELGLEGAKDTEERIYQIKCNYPEEYNRLNIEWYEASRDAYYQKPSLASKYLQSCSNMSTEDIKSEILDIENQLNAIYDELSDNRTKNLHLNGEGLGVSENYHFIVDLARKYPEETKKININKYSVLKYELDKRTNPSNGTTSLESDAPRTTTSLENDVPIVNVSNKSDSVKSDVNVNYNSDTTTSQESSVPSGSSNTGTTTTSLENDVSIGSNTDLSDLIKGVKYTSDTGKTNINPFLGVTVDNKSAQKYNAGNVDEMFLKPDSSTSNSETTTSLENDAPINNFGPVSGISEKLSNTLKETIDKANEINTNSTSESYSNSGSIDPNTIDYSRISTNAEDALKGDFINESNVKTEYFKDGGNITYQVRDDGSVLISKDGVAMGYTDKENLDRAFSEGTTIEGKIE